jgi:putative ABC transport system ATP-binding protein
VTTPGTGALIVVDRVSKSYYRDALEVPVLRGIDLILSPGEFIALMGPSGSGKTTLLNLIAGLDRPTAGRVVVAGEEVSSLGEEDLADWRAENVGLIFQLYNLIPVMTAYENVELPLLLTPLGRKERREHAHAALSIVGLADRMDHYPRQLSGGQEQRVAIARALVTDPVILVADEPTGDLDAKSADEILRLLVTLNRDHGKTIVMVTHDPKAAACARNLVHLDKGVLRREPQVSDIRRLPPQVRRERAAETTAAYGPFSEGFVAVSDPDSPEEAERAMRRRWAREVALGFEGLSTEEVIDLMKRLEGVGEEPRPPVRPRPKSGITAAPAPPPGTRRTE